MQYWLYFNSTLICTGTLDLCMFGILDTEEYIEFNQLDTQFEGVHNYTISTVKNLDSWLVDIEASKVA